MRRGWPCNFTARYLPHTAYRHHTERVQEVQLLWLLLLRRKPVLVQEAHVLWLLLLGRRPSQLARLAKSQPGSSSRRGKTMRSTLARTQVGGRTTYIERACFCFDGIFRQNVGHFVLFAFWISGPKVGVNG